jgi:hypothetical protein
MAAQDSSISGKQVQSSYNREERQVFHGLLSSYRYPEAALRVLTYQVRKDGVCKTRHRMWHCRCPGRRRGPFRKHEITFLVCARLRNELDPVVLRYESLVLQGLTIGRRMCAPEWKVYACGCYSTQSIHLVHY